MTAPDPHRQLPYALRLDWGPEGAEAVGAVEVAVVVDVLSFTTTLSVAVERGTRVLPYRWRDESAARFAEERGAVLAVGRSAAGPGEISLSPSTVRRAPAPRRLVLPSPNGATISVGLQAGGAEVLGVSLRTRAAAARYLLRRRESEPDLRVAVIAAGERWPGGGLRPAVEDLWGGGALVDLLIQGGWRDVAPEAAAAAAAFRSVEPDVGAALRACASGRELIDAGYPSDVEIAAELDRSPSVPVLREGAFVGR